MKVEENGDILIRKADQQAILAQVERWMRNMNADPRITQTTVSGIASFVFSSADQLAEAVGDKP